MMQAEKIFLRVSKLMHLIIIKSIIIIESIIVGQLQSLVKALKGK